MLGRTPSEHLEVAMPYAIITEVEFSDDDTDASRRLLDEVMGQA